MTATVALPDSLHGVTVPIVTPFDPTTSSIDHAALAEHADRMLQEGASALLAADFVGESWALSTDEKVSVVHTTVRATEGRAPVIAKLSEPSLVAQTELARRVAEAGADVVKLALPRESSAQDTATLLSWLTGPPHAAGLPFMVEGYADVPVPVLDSLCADELFIGYEEASRDVTAFWDIISRYGNDIIVVAGSEDVLAYTLLGGAKGFMTASPNFAPGFMTTFMKAASAHEVTRTFEMFEHLRTYRRLFYTDLEAGIFSFVPYTKACMSLAGHPVGPPRTPLRPLDEDEHTALRQVLEQSPMVPGISPGDA